MVGRCTLLELKILLEVWMVEVLSQPEMAQSLKVGEWGIYAGKTKGVHDYIQYALIQPSYLTLHNKHQNEPGHLYM